MAGNKSEFERRQKRRYTKKIKRFTRTNRGRLRLVFSFLIICLSALMIRLVFIDVTLGESYERNVLTILNYGSDAIPNKRGDITDRNGTVLATSEKQYKLILDAYVANESKDENAKAYTAYVLAKYFGKNEQEMLDEINNNPTNRYDVLESNMTYDQRREFDEFMNSDDPDDQKIINVVKNTIWFEESYSRVYPFSTLACDVIGFVTGDENASNYGLEGSYNDVLTGTDGRKYGYINDDIDMQNVTRQPQNGNTVVSTLDVNIQRIAEKYVGEFMSDVGADNVAAIVMDPNNGEVLAMASAPVFDCNDPHDDTVGMSKQRIKYWLERKNDASTGYKYTEADLVYTLWRNYCVDDSFEPGSTAKTMTVAYAMDQAAVNDADHFECDGGQTYPSDQTFVSCNGYHGDLKLEETLMYSCNDAMMQIADLMGKETFLALQKTFGIGQKTGIDLPGEDSWSNMVYHEDTMGPIELWTSSFGQGYNASMIQIATAFCSIINGGSFYKPHIVKEILDDNGSKVEVFDKTLERMTISRATSDWMRETLYKTVEEGTGTPAKVPGYKIGGKTGTSEVGVRGSDDRTVSFIGFAPADDPQIVVYVVVDRAYVDDQGQSEFASKIAGGIFSEVLPYLQIFPTEPITDEEQEEFLILHERPEPQEAVSDEDVSVENDHDEGEAVQEENSDEPSEDKNTEDENSEDENSEDENSEDENSEDEYSDDENPDDGSADNEVSDDDTPDDADEDY